ncbi:uncharacterized protein [Nicotiana sylvestris]|uniref:uncharacterized protein n=1 Tax=Nicotiana sylvestris TaxID=4096 RepID=UPI00388C8DE6
MDFVVELPRTHRKFDAVWIIVDRLTKSVHFIPVAVSYSSERLAVIYIWEIIRLHGVPVSIISDQVDYILFNDPPADIVADNSNSANIVVADDVVKKKFEKDNKIVRGHLLNHITNPLFDLFINYKSAKVVWDNLEKKYGADDVGKKKYVFGKWIKFQMVDDKPIMEQVHEYENLTADSLNEGMEMCEILQANVLLEKFPSSWSDYRNQLKQKKKNLTLQELISHMRTEEANRLKDEESERLQDM